MLEPADEDGAEDEETGAGATITVTQEGDRLLRRSYEEDPEDGGPRQSSSRSVLMAQLAVVLASLAFLALCYEPATQNVVLQLAGGAASPEPPLDAASSFEGCGTWQAEYMALHRRILAGELPPRYLVAHSPDKGFSDRLTGAITGFYHALLSGRAYQVTTGRQAHLPVFEDAFDAPFVDWRRPTNRLDGVVYAHGHAASQEILPVNPAGVSDTDPSVRYWVEKLVNDQNKTDLVYGTEDLSSWHSNVETLFLVSNRGALHRLFENPHHRQRLLSMGLTPETAFSCAFNFLFRPNRHLQSAFEEQLARLQQGEEEGAVRVGIQIRVGDGDTVGTEDVFEHGGEGRPADAAVQLDDYRWYFDCAEQIGRAAAGGGKGDDAAAEGEKKVVWYLASDSETLREQAMARYGPDRLVTRLGQHRHTQFSHCPPREARACRRDAILDIAGDILALTRTDYQVVSVGSGVGRMAAAIKRAWTTVHMSPQERKAPQEAQCTLENYSTYEDIALGWSGI